MTAPDEAQFRVEVRQWLRTVVEPHPEFSVPAELDRAAAESTHEGSQ